MSTSDSRQSPARLQKRAAVTLVCGIALVALSFLPSFSSGRDRWTKDQAREYQDASMRIQQLTHKLGTQTPDTASQATSDEFKEAIDHFEGLKLQLADAQSRTGLWATLLRLSGIALLMIAAARFLAMRQDR